MRFHNCILTTPETVIPGAGKVRKLDVWTVAPWSFAYLLTVPTEADTLIGHLEKTLSTWDDAAYSAKGPYSLIAIDAEPLMPHPVFKTPYWPQAWPPLDYARTVGKVLDIIKAAAARVYPDVPVTTYPDPLEPYWLRKPGADKETARASWLVGSAVQDRIRPHMGMPAAHVYLTKGLKAADYQTAVMAYGEARRGTPWSAWTMTRYEGSPVDDVPESDMREVVQLFEAAGATDVVWFGSGLNTDPNVAAAESARFAAQVPTLASVAASFPNPESTE